MSSLFVTRNNWLQVSFYIKFMAILSAKLESEVSEGYA